MNGYIANTDAGWHAILLAQQRREGAVREANFWKPSDRPFGVLRPGEPMLFRLKAPHNAIGGVGFFQRFSALPVWLAWETFGRANGVQDRHEMEQRLLAIRARNKVGAVGEPQIGCVLLSDLLLFEPGDWVRLPDDWKPTTVSGKGYDLASGEGARVWASCQERLARAAAPLLVADEQRYGEPIAARSRLGQGGFRVAVIDAYDRACAVTGERSLPALEAAHIRPYADDGSHDVRNGLLLRSDVHRLYDRGYVTVTPDHRFRVSPRLRADYANGKTYYALDGRRIATPKRSECMPSNEALAWHEERCFLRA